jgi:hypothetical protein
MAASWSCGLPRRPPNSPGAQQPRRSASRRKMSCSIRPLQAAVSTRG